MRASRGRLGLDKVTNSWTVNTGWVSVGTDHDTSAFAVATLRAWWDSIGRCRYPSAGRLMICAGGGGSNGSRVRAWQGRARPLCRRHRSGGDRRPPAACTGKRKGRFESVLLCGVGILVQPCSYRIRVLTERWRRRVLGSPTREVILSEPNGWAR